MFDWHIISLDQNAANVVHFDGPKKYPLSGYSWIIPPATVHLSCIVFKQIEFFFMIFVIDILVELHQELADHFEDHAGLGQCRQ